VLSIARETWCRLIQSNYQAFGSGIVATGTGFALHDRGGLFSMDATSPNALAGRKRPLHTIIPAFAQKGDVRVAFGIMGGWNQSQAHAQFVANLVDFKNEYSGGAGGAAVQQADVQRLRRDDGESLWAECAERIDEQRPQDRGERDIFQRYGRRASGCEGLFGGSELWGFGPPEGWRSVAELPFE